MIRHVWTVLCNKSNIDKDSNNITLVDVLERLGLPEEPEPGTALQLPGGFEVVSLWSRTEIGEPERGQGRFLLELPSGDQRPARTFDIDLRDYVRLRTRQQISGIPFEETGLYWFVIQFRYDEGEDWRDVAHVPLEVWVDAE